VLSIELHQAVPNLTINSWSRICNLVFVFYNQGVLLRSQHTQSFHNFFNFFLIRCISLSIPNFFGGREKWLGVLQHRSTNGRAAPGLLPCYHVSLWYSLCTRFLYASSHALPFAFLKIFRRDYTVSYFIPGGILTRKLMGSSVPSGLILVSILAILSLLQ